MRLEVYRKRQICGGFVADDSPEIVFCNIAWFDICGNTISGNICGEELTVNMDTVNYKYMFISE